ncbi:capsular polysaccharide biosynthesis protein [Rhabdobacter roseus]|uniref:protein-tyrosine-phosphatase n=1 Tax=Rhabdobacter roseus TaxID=1655419 RepID=A0A840TUP6_9BACT|nr:CpsB/CapC family capsule biosynthesis tyrosine phosphatase [Rhabdobacter roseus]MBB5284983.1 tyrosine-protein phosphatase YwqE [Rhabdobacter roseus]
MASLAAPITHANQVLASLGSDLHVHLLPGIDDGARTVADGLTLLEKHYQSGIRSIVATPHVRADFFLNTQASIRAAWELIYPEAQRQWPDLRLTYAAEYFADDYLMSLIEQEELLPLFDRYLLVETSMNRESPYLSEIIRTLLDKGWKPVLAHPERYRPWHKRPDRYAELHEMNVIFQVNLLSLAGVYGPAEKAMAEKLIHLGWVGAVGSDLHHPNQYHYIQKAVQNPFFQMLNDVPLLNHALLHTTRNE